MRWILIIGLALALASCASSSGHGRWSPQAEQATAPAPKSEVVPTVPEPIVMEPAPEAEGDVQSTVEATVEAVAPVVEDPIAIYLAAEAPAFAALEAQALATVRDIIASTQSWESVPGPVGPALQWYPALGVVAAQERRVSYGEPRLAGPIMSGEATQRPFRVGVHVPCRIATRSGQGIAIQGDVPANVEFETLLPRSTQAANLAIVSKEHRSAAEQAITACLATEAVATEVVVMIPLVYERSAARFVVQAEKNPPLP